MTKNPMTWVHCTVCERKMGKKPGVQVVLGLVCDDPICQYQGQIDLNAQRDSFIVNAMMAGISVNRIAVSSKISRQRVYQIFNNWKAGV